MKNSIFICNKIKMPTFIEVCAGAGGLSKGLINVGFTPLLLNDNDKNCCNTLRKNHPDVEVVCGGMENLELDKYVGKVDLLTGGVPCQSFSMAGKRKGLEDPRGQLMVTFANMIEKLKPKAFMIENVKGLKFHNSGETLKSIIELLETKGEYTISYQVLNSVNYNVPQKRERIFIVGVKGKKEFKFPKPSEKVLTIKSVLNDVPESECSKYNDRKKELFKMIPPGGCWINLPEDVQREYLGNSYNSGGGKRGILRRMSMDEPSLTLLCSPSQKQTERCHPLEERPFSIREYARIQTFPDDYEFAGSVSSQYKQIGNAVPVKLSEKMGKRLIKYFK